MIIQNRGLEAISDDLDRFVENLKIGSNLVGKKQEGLVKTLQFVQLTEDELKLLENMDPKFMCSFQNGGFQIKWNEMEFIQISGSRLTLKWSGSSN